MQTNQPLNNIIALIDKSIWYQIFMQTNWGPEDSKYFHSFSQHEWSKIRLWCKFFNFILTHDAFFKFILDRDEIQLECFFSAVRYKPKDYQHVLKFATRTYHDVFPIGQMHYNWSTHSFFLALISFCLKRNKIAFTRGIKSLENKRAFQEARIKDAQTEIERVEKSLIKCQTNETLYEHYHCEFGSKYIPKLDRKRKPLNSKPLFPLKQKPPKKQKLVIRQPKIKRSTVIVPVAISSPSSSDNETSP